MVKQPTRIRACPYCGSAQVEPLVIFGGPLAAVDNKNETFRCTECGEVAVPVDFESIESWKEFVRQKKGGEQINIVPEGFLHIPILPVDTSSLQVGNTSLPIGRRARVVSIGWDGQGLVIADPSSSFAEYWRTVGGSRYNAKDILMLDLAGIRNGDPNFNALKALVKRRYEVWIELGMRDVQDLFDAFALDIKMAVAGSITARDPKLFEEIFELSDSCIPLIYVDRDVVWGKKGAGPSDLSRAIKMMTDIGYDLIGVIDLPRLGERNGISDAFLSRVEGLDADLILGGGVIEKDLGMLEGKGIKGAFIDPFSPVISSILREEGDPVTADEPVPMTLMERSPHPMSIDGRSFGI